MSKKEELIEKLKEKKLFDEKSLNKISSLNNDDIEKILKVIDENDETKKLLISKIEELNKSKEESAKKDQFIEKLKSVKKDSSSEEVYKTAEPVELNDEQLAENGKYKKAYEKAIVKKREAEKKLKLLKQQILPLANAIMKQFK